MRSFMVEVDLRLSVWLRVRGFAVPQSMIESATARRAVGDWAGACAVARVDTDLDLQAVAASHGRDLAAEVRTDLRHLAPDLLRWHMPRTGEGLLRPGLTVSLARYGPVQLVARTAPAWADSGQRISVALWPSTRPSPGGRAHPHPRPGRRFRFDLHRHLWDARESGRLRSRVGAWGGPPAPDAAGPFPSGCAVHRWDAEAALLRQADGLRAGEPVLVRAGRRRFLLDPDVGTPRALSRRTSTRAYAVLPDAATWVPPDLELLRAGLITADRLHPLVAAALCPHPSARPPSADVSPRRTSWRLVECGGEQHRIGPVDGVLVPLDHDPDEIRREELLAALGGSPMPCLRVIDRVHRSPESLTDIRARLDHGDVTGALAAVEDLLGPNALLRAGALRDELEAAAAQRVTHGLYRAGLAGRGPLKHRPTGPKPPKK